MSVWERIIALRLMEKQERSQWEPNAVGIRVILIHRNQKEEQHV